MRNTINYNLPIFDVTDKFAIAELNRSNSIVDSAIGSLQETVSKVEIDNLKVTHDMSVIRDVNSDLENKFIENNISIETIKNTVNEKASSTEVFSYEYSTQDTLPPKQGGIISCTPKIVKKMDSQSLMVIQKTNKGYMRYTLNNKNVSPSDLSNYGTNGELIRLIDARHLVDVCVYKDLSVPFSGTLGVATPTTNDANFVERKLLDLTSIQNNRNISSKGANAGFGIYTMTTGQIAQWVLNATKSNKANILFQTSSGSTTEVKIYINNVLIKTFNPKRYFVSTAMTDLIEFEVPNNSQATTYNVKIEVSGASGNFYPCCFNFSTLENFDGMDIDNWKGFGSIQGASFVTTGANEYAMADNTNKWFSSYHGGETLESCEVLWLKNNKYATLESDIVYSNFSDIPLSDWKIFKNKFDIKQRTNLLGKAKMNSVFDFSEDGTMNQKMALDNTGEEPIIFNALYTALTCTSPSFNFLVSPVYKDLGLTPTERSIQIGINEGFVSQFDSINNLQLDIRHNKFNYKNNALKCYILDSQYYKKHYYGVVTNTRNVFISNLQFSKALDFIIR